MKQITAKDLKERMVSDKELVVINVLNSETYADCHIKDSINIPLPELEAKTYNWDKEKPIVVYCASYQCTASRKGYDALTLLGFTNVIAYEGGMKEWAKMGFAKEGTCAASYLK